LFTYFPSPPKTGNAATLVSQDNSSNTFLHLSTPNQTGLAIGGGAYPLDTSRAMGVLGWTNASQTASILSESTFQIAQTMVSGKYQTKIPFSIGINNYQPETEKYLMTVNGPMHITNGQLTLVEESPFVIQNISMAPYPNTNGIAVGYPTSVISGSTPTLNYKVLYTTDGGNTWSLSNQISNSGTFTNGIHNPIAIFSYDNSNAFLATDTQAFIFYSLNGGLDWTPIVFSVT
jgi:hypothetical protein